MSNRRTFPTWMARSLLAIQVVLSLPLAEALAGPLDGSWHEVSGFGRTPPDSIKVAQDQYGGISVRSFSSDTPSTSSETSFRGLFFKSGNWGPSLIDRTGVAFGKGAHMNSTAPSGTYLAVFENGSIVRWSLSSVACLKGDSIASVGRDTAGRVILDMRALGPDGGKNMGMVRFSRGQCHDLRLGLDSTRKIVSYASDSLGREYFGIGSYAASGPCLGLLRMIEGRIDTLLPGTCINAVLPLKDEVLIGGNTGLRSLGPSNGIKAIESLTGKRIGNVRALHIDRWGAVWIGADGATSEDGTILAAQYGSDTVTFRVPHGYTTAHSFGTMAEDDFGSMFVAGKWNVVKVFVREGGRIPHPSPSGYSGILQRKGVAMPAYQNGGVDALGRRLRVPKAILPVIPLPDPGY